MAFRIVTDSTADLPQSLVEEFGISVVPVYVQFGKEAYRDRLDISESEFYEQLLHFPVHPTTSQPSPRDFVDVYKDLGKDASGIISIHISSKLSGTFNSALRGKDMAEIACPIEVIDTNMVSMGIGLTVIEAARIAASGENFQQVIEKIRRLVSQTRFWVLFDTLKYLAMGGRIGKAQSLLGSVLNIKPLLTLKDGEFIPAARPRSFDKGIDMLYGFAEKAGKVEDISVMYTTTSDNAEALAARLESLCGRPVKIARVGPALGVHAGPGAVAIALRSSQTG